MARKTAVATMPHAIPHAHRSRVACSRSGYAAPLVGHVVDENVFAEMLRLNVEGTPVVDLRHLIDEVDEVMTAGEHEGIDRDALACAADHFAQRCLERALRRRVVELRVGASRLEI